MLQGPKSNPPDSISDKAGFASPPRREILRRRCRRRTWRSCATAYDAYDRGRRRAPCQLLLSPDCETRFRSPRRIDAVTAGLRRPRLDCGSMGGSGSRTSRIRIGLQRVRRRRRACVVVSTAGLPEGSRGSGSRDRTAGAATVSDVSEGRIGAIRFFCDQARRPSKPPGFRSRRCRRRTWRSSRRAYAAFNRHDFDAALGAVDPNVEWHQITQFPDRAVYRGREDMRDRFWNQQLVEQFGDVRIDVEEFD